ncbi:MAG: hypothetical protein GY913_35405 [Proteobacteria bacterium]|nr:hypothetical protein [Pseudomonadota bacterium]MCP4922219.1 hypothetical protein [Pseudomonadota bacterium]
MWNQLEDQGLAYLAVMLEDDGGKKPSEEACARWASDLDLTHAVVADEEQQGYDFIVSGFPTFVVIDREMVIIEDDLWPFDPSFVEDEL